MNKDFRQYLKIIINLVIAAGAFLIIVLFVPKVILFLYRFLSAGSLRPSRTRLSVFWRKNCGSGAKPCRSL